MNGQGIIIAVVSFLCIGLFHPLVIWAEYIWSARCWPAFLVAGLGFLAASLLPESILLSSVLGVLGCSCLWSIGYVRGGSPRIPDASLLRRGGIPVILTVDQVGDLLDEIAESFPSALFQGLNGGVCLQEEALPDPEFREVYILGEYCHDCLGLYINLYYGSFAALAEQEEWNRETWLEELRITLAHELTHHLEHLSGLHALDDRDAEELAIWRAEYQGDS